ncbi:MAG: hypothetical protein J6S07_06725, partial [Bacteroidaceae bacterium]|nr:hypothetical protein [Bacteroidaceae bacterium]
EAMSLEWYNKDLCKDAEEQDLDVDIACEGGSIFLYHNSEFFVESGEYYPYWEMFGPNGPTCGTLNHVLERGLRYVLITKFGGYDVLDLALFFSRAYAYVLHALNIPRPEYDYKSFKRLWEEDKELRGDAVQCELICACMVHCILDYEKDPHLLPLLQEIEWRLQASQRGVDLDTLKVFQEAVAQSIGATEEPCQGEQQPKADPPLEEKEEETPPAPATKDDYFHNTALVQFREAGGLEKWAGLVNEAIQDIADKTPCTRLDNTMLAVMYYFASGWRKRKGIFKKEPDGKQLVHFFLSRCAFSQPTVCGKSLVNKLNELLNGDKRITETDETEEVRKKIKEIIGENS